MFFFFCTYEMICEFLFWRITAGYLVVSCSDLPWKAVIFITLVHFLSSEGSCYQQNFTLVVI